MPRIFRRVTVPLAIVSLFLVFLPQGLNAQFPPPTPQQLDQLLAPIALFPDNLLAQITTASTDPQQILEATDWLAGNPNASGDLLMDAAHRQGFDPAFVALMNFPGVLEMMADNIDDYAALGQAVLADQGAVAASIQRLRTTAWQTGALRNTSQQTVNVTFNGGVPIYSIVPTNPQVVYVPFYDPSLVFIPGTTVGTVISFAPGIGIGPLWASTMPWGWGGWGWNWGVGSIMFNRVVWGPSMWTWRSRNPWFRPRPIIWANRPGFGGNWRHRPPNWRPPSNTGRPRPVRPGTGGRPSFGRPGAGRPGGPGNNRPGGPGGTRPGNNRPGVGGPGNRPGTGPGNRPGTGQPNRPGPGAGNRPGAGAGNRPGVGAGNRPGGGQPNRPGGNRQPAQRPQGRPQAQTPPQQRPPAQQRPPNTGGGQPGRGNQAGGNPGGGNRGGGNQARGGGGNRGGGNPGGGNRGGGGNPQRGQRQQPQPQA
jgi:hypothetical protein